MGDVLGVLGNARTLFLVLVSLVCVAVGVLALVARVLFPLGAPSAGPPATVLADMPLAVANLLANDLNLSEDAASAALLGLAQQGVVEFVDFGAGDEVLFLRRPEAVPALAYERQVFEFVGALPRLNEGVPLAAVRAATADTGWWKRFGQAVIEDARRAGLVAPRYAAGLVWTVQGGLALCVVAGVLALGDSDNPKPSDPAGWAVLATFLTAGLAFLAVRRVDRKALRYTQSGRDWAAFWLGARAGYAEAGAFDDVPPAGVAIWGQHLAAATTLGVAREASQRLHLAVGDGSSVWYVANDRWVHARVRHPGAPWGSSPVSVLWSGLGSMLYSCVVLAAIAFVATRVAGSTDSADRQRAADQLVTWFVDRLAVWRDPSSHAFAWAAAVLIGIVVLTAILYASLRSLQRWLSALGDLVLRRNERGWVASLRDGWIVVGDGQDETLVAFRCPSQILDGVGVGDVVELEATRFLGHVRAVRKLTGPDRPPH